MSIVIELHVLVVTWIQILSRQRPHFRLSSLDDIRNPTLHPCKQTAVFRFKQLLGNNLRSRCFVNQKAEVHAKSIALNTMIRLGMPHSERIAT